MPAAATAAGHAEPMALAAELFGMTCGDLALRHWPDQGLWLAGSAARAMAREGAAFLSGLEAAFAAKGMPPAVIDHLRDMPVVEIADDLAPLLVTDVGADGIAPGDVAEVLTDVMVDLAPVVVSSTDDQSAALAPVT